MLFMVLIDNWAMLELKLPKAQSATVTAPLVEQWRWVELQYKDIEFRYCMLKTVYVY